MKQTHHLVYKVTNTINDKYYIGIHSTTDIDDGYMGSGTAIKKAIMKHGIENFKKEILFEPETRTQALLMEYMLVTKKVVDSEDSYNLIEGGKGFNSDRFDGWNLTAEKRSEMFSGENNGFYGKTHSKDTRAKIGKAKETPKEIEEQRLLQFQAEPKTRGWKGRLGKLWGISPQKVTPWLKSRGLH